MTLTVTSRAFMEGGTIPVQHTCDGENLSPQVAWSEAPSGTQSFALIMDDPDAPVGTYVHWVLYDLPSGSLELPEAVQSIGTSGVNSSRKSGYTGPCPPLGKPHHYNFKVYALDTVLRLEAGGSKADLEKAMQGHILAWGRLVGVYGR